VGSFFLVQISNVADLDDFRIGTEKSPYCSVAKASFENHAFSARDMAPPLSSCCLPRKLSRNKMASRPWITLMETPDIFAPGGLTFHGGGAPSREIKPVDHDRRRLAVWLYNR